MPKKVNKQFNPSYLFPRVDEKPVDKYWTNEELAKRLNVPLEEFEACLARHQK